MKKLLTLIFALIAMISTVYAQEAEPDYLYFEVTEGTTISLKKESSVYSSTSKKYPDIQYSYDKVIWNAFSTTSDKLYSITVPRDCFVYFRGVNTKGINSDDGYVSFVVSNQFKCGGNIMTLIDGIGETLVIPNERCFFRLFQDCPLTTAPELPATTLASSCYSNMFVNCVSLTSAPKLPATTLASSCYSNMFMNCVGLTSAPKLPATTLASSCYFCMFGGCINLSVAPELPATELTRSCYSHMFENCTSLTTAPELPATTLSTGCYTYMFEECTSLTSAPELPATTLASSCYSFMFYGCTSLTTAPKLPATRLESHCYEQMFTSCTSLTAVPELPATELPAACYYSMFQNCTSLTTAPVLLATILTDGWCCLNMFRDCTKLNKIVVNFSSFNKGTNNWVKNVSKTGTFVCPSDLKRDRGPSTIPNGWDVICTYSIRNLSPDDITLSTTTALPDDKVTITVNDKVNYLPILYIDDCKIPLIDGKYIYTMQEKNVEVKVEYKMYCVTNLSPEAVMLSSDYANDGETIRVTIAKKDYYQAHLFVNNQEIEGTTFTMPDKDVQVKVVYTPIEYVVSFADVNVAIDKSKATAEDKVNLTVKDRTSEGYKLDNVLVNSTEIAVQNYKASFDMKDYLQNVTITAQYSKIPYTITTDEYSQVANTTANVDDIINVTFKQLDGYNLTSATYNGIALTVDNYKSSFPMPAANVEIKTQYTKIPYTISTNEYSQVANPTANMGDVVNVTFKQREGYTLTSATYNGTALTVSNYKSSFTMPAANVEIKTQYTKIPYAISTDEYSQVANSAANMGDVVNVTFKQRDGYTLTSATYNGNALSISDYKSSFTMPVANVEIKAVYAPIAYTVSCADANITADKTTATIDDKVNLTITDCTSEGYKLDKVLVNSTELAVRDFKASFDMKDYLKDVTISAQYSKIPYTITADEYSQVANTTATVDDAITVTFKQREGFDLTSATCNGNPLNINDYKATFTMPAQDVEIKTVYTEKVYEIEKQSEGVSVSQPSAKAGDEITISVNPKDGYTVHLYVNGAEVALSGNSAVYTMPSGKIEITVKYVVEEKTPVSEIELDNCAVSVFPNPAKSGEEITLKVGGKFDMNNAKIYLYNASGSLVMQIDNVNEYNQLTLRSGVYVGVLVTKGGKKTFRVAVE